MPDEDEFGGVEDWECYYAGEMKCEECYRPDCPRSMINTEMSFDALAAEMT